MIKKLLAISLAATVGRLVLARIRAGRAEQDLWAEATDPVAPAH